MRFSPAQKLRLALDNLINPFNLATIFGEAGIEVAANSHYALRSRLSRLGQIVGGQLHPGHDRSVLRHLPDSHRHPHGSALPSPPRPQHSAPRPSLCRSDLLAARRQRRAHAQLLPDRCAHHRHLHLESLCARPANPFLCRRRALRHRLGHCAHRQPHHRIRARRSPATSTRTSSSSSASSTRSPSTRRNANGLRKHHAFLVGNHRITPAPPITCRALHASRRLRSPPPNPRPAPDSAIRCSPLGLTGLPTYPCNDLFSLRFPHRNRGLQAGPSILIPGALNHQVEETRNHVQSRQVR